MYDSSIDKDSCSCRGGVSLDALSIFIIRMKIQNFKTTIVEKVGYIKEYIYIMFLNEL